MAELEVCDGYIKLIYAGPWQLDVMKAHLEQASAFAQEANTKNALFDYLGVTTPPNILDLHLIGKHAAQEYRLTFHRVAVTIRKEYISKMAEDTAVNRGLRALVTPDLNEAIEWLTETP